MKYYLIAGEASGDLHASHLMKSLRKVDKEADFRFFGGELMAQEGGTRVRHYKELSYMGFVPVVLHLRTILRNMNLCKRDIIEWRPNVVILVDYPGFNLRIAHYVHSHSNIPVYYYISPKIWAWKEYRIKNIKRDVDEMFSILPFEVDFYGKKHRYPVHYVGNPTADEVRNFRGHHDQSFERFTKDNGLSSQRIIALLAGSRKQEIKDNLPSMIRAAETFANGSGDYQLVLAGAPAIDGGYYQKIIGGKHIKIVRNNTFPLLSHSTAALVTSGTATLEAALFGVPQVVCYETPMHRLFRWLYNHVLKVKYVSLVNLIMGKEVVKELVADLFTTDNLREELRKILPGESRRDEILRGYRELRELLGDRNAADNAARIMFGLLNKVR